MTIADMRSDLAQRTAMIAITITVGGIITIFIITARTASKSLGAT
jgi:hypothetical protein